jgi:beta-1,4-mannosyl-glycoprotein beta-1,4-N-acetylglucosaminyltransferase
VEDFPYKCQTINNQAWTNEFFQRNAISRGLQSISLHDNDGIIIADADEIPDPNTLYTIKKGMIIVDMNTLEMDFYYYNLNTRINMNWPLCRILSYKKYKEINKTCDEIRKTCCSVIKNGGWHLSFFGDSQFIKNKINHFSHQEFNNEQYTDLSKIEERIKQGTDLFNRDISIEKVEICNNTYLPPKYEMYLTNFFSV